MKKIYIIASIIICSLTYSEGTGVISGYQDATRRVASEFVFEENSIYEIWTKPQYLSEIVLQPGEEILYIGGGDTSRWVLDKSIGGSEEGDRWRIYIKPTDVELSTNLVISTNKRSYRLDIKSNDELYNPIVTFKYPRDEKLAFERASAEKKSIEDSREIINNDPSKMNFSYSVQHKFFSPTVPKYWSGPTEVFDDGAETYLVMPKEVMSRELPTLVMSEKGSEEDMLVNFRVKNNVIIVDRLFEEAYLILDKRRLKITNKSL